MLTRLLHLEYSQFSSRHRGVHKAICKYIIQVQNVRYGLFILYSRDLLLCASCFYQIPCRRLITREITLSLVN